MSEKLEVRKFDESALCGWCGIPLGSANLVRESVCIRCYELLIAANLTNEEIFSGEKRKRLNFPLNLDKKVKE